MAEPAAVSRFAPAKINLYLHVVGRRDDGYHLLDSLVAFADIGDRVTAVRAPDLSLTVAGPEAGALGGLGDDNLVLRAARFLAGETGVAAGAALHLEKHLPAASGIGGGSSDAAAALRALAALWQVPLDRLDPAAVAKALGADVPACLVAQPLWVSGIGEVLEPAGSLPEFGVVLANPRRELPTAAVFRARTGPFGAAGRFAPPGEPAAWIAALARCRNDLAAPAQGLLSEIGDVLACLAGLPGTLLARMSGSGATCFALFADGPSAAAAAANMAQPGWWIAAGRLLSRPV